MNLRNVALTAGQKTYSTGRPCRQGHISERYTSNGMCIECLKQQGKNISDMRAFNRRKETRLLANHIVPFSVMLPYRTDYSTVIQSLETLGRSSDWDAFCTWIAIMADKPLGYAQLAIVFDWRDGAIHVDPNTIPYRNNDAGLVLFEIEGSWYVGDEINEVLRGLRPHVNRVIDPI